MKKTIQLSSQNHFVFSNQLKAGLQGVLSRTAHVQAGDDVENFCHIFATIVLNIVKGKTYVRLFSTQLKNRLGFFPVRKEHKYYLWDWGMIERSGKVI